MNFNNKKIILAMTPDMGLFRCFEDNLKALGFEVFTITTDYKFTYQNINQRLINFSRKTFLKDKKYKHNLRKQFIKEKHLEALKDIPFCDYGLCIRPDLFDNEVIEVIKQKSKKAVAYQWDGIHRFPEVLEKVTLFDRFFVFDKKDIEVVPHGITLTNCYFDCYKEALAHKTTEYDLFFIGTLDKRSTTIIDLCETLYQRGFKINLILSKIDKKPTIFKPYITYIKGIIDYKANVELASSSKAMLDFRQNFHTGMSFRAFEALGYNKKLITNNPIIKQYDLYDNGNVFVFDNDVEKLIEFLQQDQKDGNQNIQEKYSFSNWIKYVLDEPTAIPITIP